MCNSKKEEKDFSVIVPFESIKEKKYSFSAGQYFSIEVDYVDLTPDEFEFTINKYKKELNQLFNESKVLENKIGEELNNIKYGKN